MNNPKILIIQGNRAVEVPINVFMTELILGWGEATKEHGKLFVDLN